LEFAIGLLPVDVKANVFSNVPLAAYGVDKGRLPDLRLRGKRIC
jgi:hypothetical protein